MHVLDIYSKYILIVPLKNKSAITIANAFQNFLNESKHKQIKILVYKGSKFYNRSLKLWLQDNIIEVYSTHHERKSVVAEQLISTLKNSIYKH